MTRSGLCARPACGGPVAAWLTYDYANREVWLDADADAGAGGRSAGDGGGGHRWALCARHAERLRVPLGWAFQDRRFSSGPPATPVGRPRSDERPYPVSADTAPAAEEPGTAQAPLLPAAAG
jgi:hypothetical protein